MRLRKPPDLLEVSEKLVFKEQAHRDYTVKIITPIYGGGVESRIPDREMPFRLTAINYQLRFWWRLHKLKELRDCGVTEEQLFKKLFHEECQLWGALAGNKQYPSKVKIQFLDQTWVRENFQTCYKYPQEIQRDEKKGFQHGIPPYALFPGQGKDPRQRNRPPDSEEKPAEVILPDPAIIFTFRIVCKDDTKWSEVERALRWWASFGGIGARTRRGLGSVKVLEKVLENGDLLKPVDQLEARQYGCELRMKRGTNDAVTAWRVAIKVLQDYRQGFRPEQGRRSKREMRDGRVQILPSQSLWPEANAIRVFVDHHLPTHVPPQGSPCYFPRAAFGLPIVFHFKDGPRCDDVPWDNYDPKDCVLKPERKDRLASPIIVKAMATESGQYAPIVLRLLTEHLDGLRLELRSDTHRGDYPLDTPKNIEPDAWWPVDPAMKQQLVNSVGLLRKQDNILAAFLDYFAP